MNVCLLNVYFLGIIISLIYLCFNSKFERRRSVFEVEV